MTCMYQVLAGVSDLVFGIPLWIRISRASLFLSLYLRLSRFFATPPCENLPSLAIDAAHSEFGLIDLTRHLNITFCMCLVGHRATLFSLTLSNKYTARDTSPCVGSFRLPWNTPEGRDGQLYI